MAKFLVTYHGGEGVPSDPAAAKQMMQAFQAWATGVGSSMLDPGAPLAASKTVSAKGTKDGQAEASIGGYTLLQANNLVDAVALVENHPFLARGGTLQINEVVNLGG